MPIVASTHISASDNFQLGDSADDKHVLHGHLSGSYTSTGSFGRINVAGTTNIGGPIYVTDNKQIYLGTDEDFSLYHNGSHAYLNNTTGNIYYRNDVAGASHIFMTKYGGGSLTSVFEVTDGGAILNQGNLTVANDIIIDDGGSLKEAGGTAAFTFDASGNVTKIGQDSPSSGQFLKWDGSKAVWDAASGGGGAISALNNATANELVTVGATTTELDAEANLVFDGTKLGINTTSPTSPLHVEKGNIDAASVSSFINLSGFTYSKNFNVQGEGNLQNFRDVYFSPDGKRMFGLSSSWDLNSYYLSGSWDIDSAVMYNSVLPFGSNAGSPYEYPNGFTFSSDGMNMYSVGAQYDTIIWIKLTQPWVFDKGTQGYGTEYTAAGTFSIATQETDATGIDISPDGTNIYIVGKSGDDVSQYKLSTPYDITTAAYLQNFSISSQEANVEGIRFKPSGDQFYIVGSSGDEVNVYNLTTNWDISTATAHHTIDVSGQDTDPNGLYVSHDGKNLYIAGDAGNTVDQWVTNLSGSLAPETYHTGVNRFYGTFQSIGDSSFDGKIDFRPNSEVLISSSSLKLDGGGAKLSSIYSNNISDMSASFVREISVGSATPSNLQNNRGIFFSPDGRRMYLTDLSNDPEQWALSTPWDISTGIRQGEVSNLASTSYSSYVAFSDDGLTMFAFSTHNSSKIVEQLSLTKPWDILHTAPSNVKQYTLEGLPSDGADGGFWFGKGGTRMYVAVNDVGKNIVQYNMSGSWDIGTISGVSGRTLLFTSDGNSHGPADANPADIAFNGAGTVMYIMGRSNMVSLYELGNAWEISSAQYIKDLPILAKDTDCQGLYVSPDQKNLYIAGNQNDKEYQYALTYNEISTAGTIRHEGDFHVSSDLTVVGHIETEFASGSQYSTASFGVVMSGGSVVGSDDTSWNDGTATRISGSSTSTGSFAKVAVLNDMSIGPAGSSGEITLNGSSGAIGAVTVGGLLTQAAQDNITSVGVLSAVVTSGNITSTGVQGKISGSSTSTGSFGRVEVAKLDVRYAGGAIQGGLEVNTSSDLGHLDIPSMGAGTLNGVAIGSTSGKEQSGAFTTVTTTGNVSGSSTSTGSYGYVYSDGDSKFAGSMTIGGGSGEITINGIIGNIAAASFTGPLTGNADTATKIASITNSDIVQLTETQTLTNKTLTSPVINVTSDAEGDIYYRSSGGAFTRLARGTDDHVLTMNGNVPNWEASQGGGGGGGSDTDWYSGTNFITASFTPQLSPNVQVTGSMVVSGSAGSSTASLSIYGSGSSVFKVEGTNGALFSVTDVMSGSIFSANLISGLPVIEAFSDNKVTIGQYADPLEVYTNAASRTVISGSQYSTASFGHYANISASVAAAGFGSGGGGGGGGGNLTTKGDIEAYTNTQTRLAVGTNDYVLTADSSTAAGIAWKVAGGGGGVTVSNNSNNRVVTGDGSNANAEANLTFDGSTLTVAGDATVTGDITIDDGGSLKEAGGTAALTFDASGHITKIGQDSPGTDEVLSWDGSKAVWATAGGGGSSIWTTTGDYKSTTSPLRISGSASEGSLVISGSASHPRLKIHGVSGNVLNVGNNVGSIPASPTLGRASGSMFAITDNIGITHFETFVDGTCQIGQSVGDEIIPVLRRDGQMRLSGSSVSWNGSSVDAYLASEPTLEVFGSGSISFFRGIKDTLLTIEDDEKHLHSAGTSSRLFSVTSNFGLPILELYPDLTSRLDGAVFGQPILRRNQMMHLSGSGHEADGYGANDLTLLVQGSGSMFRVVNEQSPRFSIDTDAGSFPHRTGSIFSVSDDWGLSYFNVFNDATFTLGSFNDPIVKRNNTWHISSSGHNEETYSANEYTVHIEGSGSHILAVGDGYNTRLAVGAHHPEDGHLSKSSCLDVNSTVGFPIISVHEPEKGFRRQMIVTGSGGPFPTLTEHDRLLLGPQHHNSTFTGMGEAASWLDTFTSAASEPIARSGDIIMLGTTSVTQGKLYHLAASTTWTLSAADVSLSEANILAIALDTAAANVGGMLLKGVASIPGSLVNGTPVTGAPVYVSTTTAGEYDFAAPSTAGDRVRVAGYCIGSDEGASGYVLIYFDPDKTGITLS